MFFSLDLLMKVLGNEVKWSSNQSVKLWFFDNILEEDID
jgi:hypothetical protein